MSNTIRWTPEQLAAHNGKLSKPIPKRPHTEAVSAFSVKLERELGLNLVKKDEARKRFQALGRLPKSRMNKTEVAYADLLEQRKRCGQIHDYKFHPANVRLADNTFYEIDFLVIDADWKLEIHEVKGGYTTEKGSLKIKLCAEALPWFRFVKVSKLTAGQGGGWNVQEF